MIPLRQVEPYPTDNPAVRGAVHYRNQNVPLLDLRVLLGGEALLKERQDLVETLVLREKEHVEWLDELSHCVREGRSFRKTLDPTKCNFGKWFYSFKTKDSLVERAVKSFEEPHARIHALGKTVLSQAEHGDKDGALMEIDRARETTLKGLVDLFTDLKHLLLTNLREIAVILRSADGRVVAVVVDSVERIRNIDLKDGSIESFKGQVDFIRESVIVENQALFFLYHERFFDIASAPASEILDSAHRVSASGARAS